MPVLVVDDEADIRLVLRELLGDEGYAVVEATYGREALAYLQAAHPAPCLILLDLMMPVMSGWEFLRARQGNPLVAAIPVVLLSAYRALAVTAVALGAQEVLAKLIDMDRLVATVQQYCSMEAV
jgi:CheY-like chemotaxis protein